MTLSAANCQTRLRLCLIFGFFFALGASELLPKREQETIKRRVLMAQQVIFAGADLDFQPSGDNSVTPEFSLSLLEKFN